MVELYSNVLHLSNTHCTVHPGIVLVMVDDVLDVVAPYQVTVLADDHGDLHVIEENVHHGGVLQVLQMNLALGVLWCRRVLVMTVPHDLILRHRQEVKDAGKLDKEKTGEISIYFDKQLNNGLSGAMIALFLEQKGHIQGYQCEM